MYLGIRNKRIPGEIRWKNATQKCSQKTVSPISDLYTLDSFRVKQDHTDTKKVFYHSKTALTWKKINREKLKSVFKQRRPVQYKIKTHPSTWYHWGALWRCYRLRCEDTTSTTSPWHHKKVWRVPVSILRWRPLCVRGVGEEGQDSPPLGLRGRRECCRFSSWPPIGLLFGWRQTPPKIKFKQENLSKKKVFLCVNIPAGFQLLCLVKGKKLELLMHGRTGRE